jgi:hypothetical protein
MFNILEFLDVEIIRSMGWPNHEAIFGDREALKFKRTSAFYIYNTLEAKIKNGSIAQEKRISKSNVTDRLSKIREAIDIRAVIDPSLVGMHRMSLSFKSDIVGVSDIHRIQNDFEFVDAVHQGMVLLRDGSMVPGLGCDIFYENKTDLDRKIKSLLELKPNMTLAEMAPHDRLFALDTEANLKKLRSYAGGLRKGIKAIMEQLILDPMIRFSEIAIKTGMTRSSAKKLYSEIMSSGAIKFEPAMNGGRIGDDTITVVTLNVPDSEKETVEPDILARSILGKRYILRRTHLQNRLEYMCWAKDYYDSLDMTKEIMNIAGEYDPQLVLFVRTFFNKESSIKLIGR